MPGPEPLVVDLADGVGAAFLTRAGGASPAPYGSLNLALHVGDDPDLVVANRRAAAAALGVDPGRTTWADQVHGRSVGVVDESDAGRGSLQARDALPDVDALVTSARDLPLAVLVADCVPVLVAAADGSAVAAVHAGRRGLLGGVLSEAITKVRVMSDQVEVRAVVGPHIGPCCYEVGSDVHDEATAVRPVMRATSDRGTPSLDLTAGVRAALAEDAVELVDVVGGCTGCRPDRWFSYRRDGLTGRMAGYVWRR